METKPEEFNEQFKRLWENHPGIVWGVAITVLADVGAIMVTQSASEFVLPRLLGQIVGFSIALFVLQRLFSWVLRKTGSVKDTTDWIAFIIAAIIYLAVFSFFTFPGTPVAPPAPGTSAQDLLDWATYKSSGIPPSIIKRQEMVVAQRTCDKINRIIGEGTVEGPFTAEECIEPNRSCSKRWGQHSVWAGAANGDVPVCSCDEGYMWVNNIGGTTGTSYGPGLTLGTISAPGKCVARQ